MARTPSRSAKRAARVSSVVAGGTSRPITGQKPSRPKSATATFTWRHLRLRVKHTPNFINDGWSHLELTVVSPKEAPCPVTSTGYLSHFIDISELNKAGGMVVFFTAWLDRDAASKAWGASEAKWRQLDLFR